MTICMEMTGVGFLTMAMTECMASKATTFLAVVVATILFMGDLGTTNYGAMQIMTPFMGKKIMTLFLGITGMMF